MNALASGTEAAITGRRSQIARDQALARFAGLRRHEFAERQADQCRQRHNPAPSDESSSAACRRWNALTRNVRRNSSRSPSASAPNVSLEGKALGQPGIDLVGVHVLAEHDTHGADPWQLLDRHAHVVRHQEGEIGGAPIGRQTEPDVDAIFIVHIGPRDEFEVGDRLVEFRIGHCL